MEEEGQCIYELVLDDEQIDSLMIALSKFKKSKNEFEFEVSDDTSIAFYHIDSQPKDKDDDDDKKDDKEEDDDDEGDWIDNNVLVSKVISAEGGDDDSDDDEGNDDEEEEVVENE